MLQRLEGIYSGIKRIFGAKKPNLVVVELFF